MARQFLQKDNLTEGSLSISRIVESIEDLLEGNDFLVLFINGFPDYSVGAFAQALELNPNAAAIEKSLGGTMEKLGRNADAAAHFQRYLELAPDAPDAKEMKKHIASLEKG